MTTKDMFLERITDPDFANLKDMLQGDEDITLTGCIQKVQAKEQFLDFIGEGPKK